MLKDHFLRRLSEAIDFRFVNRLCRNAYSELGRPGYKPMKLFKILLLQYLCDLSDRRIMPACALHADRDEVADRFSFRWFCGFSGDEALPDFCTCLRAPHRQILSRFRDRLGTKILSRIFNKVVMRARRQGLVSDRLHIVDATAMEAKVDKWKAESKEPLDPDARIGSKGNGKWFFGYKTHTNMDQPSRIITKLSVTPGNVSDWQVLHDLIDPNAPRILTGDKAYDSDYNHLLLEKNSIISAIITKSNRKNKKITARANSALRLEAKRKRRLIESKFAEMKMPHGLSVWRYWGLAKTFLPTG